MCCNTPSFLQAEGQSLMFSLCFLRCLLLDAPSLCSLAKHSSMSPPILLGLDAGVLQVPCRGLAAADCLPGEVQPARPVAGGRDHSVPADVCERLGLSPWRDCRCHSAVVCRSTVALLSLDCHLLSSTVATAIPAGNDSLARGRPLGRGERVPGMRTPSVPCV